jgi:hypothetical protein
VLDDPEHTLGLADRQDVIDGGSEVKQHHGRGEDTAEVLHVTQRSCNTSVACNTYSLASYRPAHCPLSLKPTLYRHNMEMSETICIFGTDLEYPNHEGRPSRTFLACQG